MDLSKYTGLQKMNPLDKIIYNNISESHSKNCIAYTEADNTFVSYSQYRLLVNYIYLLPRDIKILDWGAGGGHFTRILHELGFSKISAYFFLKSTEELPAIADKVSSIRANPNEPTTLPYSDCFFDIVFSVGVLEHVRESGGDERLSLAEIGKKLKPGGLLVLYHLPNKYSWIEFIRGRLGLYSHKYKYSINDIKKLTSSEFEILSIQRYGFFPRNILRKLPASVANSVIAGKLYDLLDVIFSIFFSKITQNYFVILRCSK